MQFNFYYFTIKFINQLFIVDNFTTVFTIARDFKLIIIKNSIIFTVNLFNFIIMVVITIIILKNAIIRFINYKRVSFD